MSPVTTPDELIVATVGKPVVQLPPGTVEVSGTLDILHKTAPVALPALGCGFIVIGCEAVADPQLNVDTVYTIEVVERVGVRPVTMPVVVTVAIAGPALVHIPPDTDGVSDIDAP